MKKLLLVLPILIMFVPIALFIGDSYIPFEPVAWTTERDGRVRPRFLEPRKRMFRRLVRQYQLIGMSRSELLKLLGHEEGILETGEQVYYLGSGYYLDNTYVAFSFHQKKVVSYRMILS